MENEKQLKKNIFLTFDDGPSEPYTSQILDILKEFEAKASFFVCGENVKQYPQTVERIIEEGHVIGNHTYSHSLILSLFGCLAKEIEKTTKIIQETVGVRTNFFRPPWGLVTSRLAKYLEKNNYKLILWDINTQDWQRPPVRVIEERIFSKIKPNSIILFHDGHCGKSYDRSQTVSALPPIIKKLKEQSYILKNIRELRR